jgi:hypothetical protein
MSTQNGQFVITKDLWGATGNASATSVNYLLGFAWGEAVSGDVTSNSTSTVISGYYGGRFGSSQTISLLSSQILASGAKTFIQDQIPVGVPFNAQVQLTFSDQLNAFTIANGIQILVASDHLGQPSTVISSYTHQLDSTAHVLTLVPSSALTANTLYDVRVNPVLQNVDGFPMDRIYDIYFLTLLDPHQDNMVLDPMGPGAAGTVGSSGGAVSIHIPTESLSDYSAVLLSRDPVNAPLNSTPKIIQEATSKAQASGGVYRTPIAVQEIAAYNTQGSLMGHLSQPVQLTLDYGAAFSAPGVSAGLIRPRTLALWALDQTHRLWVKIPDSQNNVGFHTVSAPVAQFSVFALMGSPDGNASDVFAFPVPWRPHGPNAGTGPGQSGTEAGGITFSNLPSECTIKIYTISGDLVRELDHSDTGGTIGQETWDVKTTHGEVVASGVYLWRVQSSADGKNGKLMVIR